MAERKKAERIVTRKKAERNSRSSSLVLQQFFPNLDFNPRSSCSSHIPSAIDLFGNRPVHHITISNRPVSSLLPSSPVHHITISNRLFHHMTISRINCQFILTRRNVTHSVDTSFLGAQSSHDQRPDSSSNVDPSNLPGDISLQLQPLPMRKHDANPYDNVYGPNLQLVNIRINLAPTDDAGEIMSMVNSLYYEDHNPLPRRERDQTEI